MKKAGLFLVLVFAVFGGGLFAHDKGDLMLNIEPQIGLVFSEVQAKHFESSSEMGVGAEFAVRGTVHYYFVDFFGLNAGMGLGGHILGSSLFSYKDEDIDYSYSVTNLLGGVFLNIPLGFRFSFGAFALGAGLTINVPLSSSSSYTETEKLGSKSETNTITEDKFSYNPYTGWYFDIGYDLSGIKERQGGFGMLFRLAGSFDDKIGDVSKDGKLGIEYNKLSMFSMSIVFQAAVELANLPIGGK